MRRVVAAVIERDGQYLMCQRPAGKRHAGLWEFPGGKVQAGESDKEAIRRELLEELAVEPADETLLIAEHPDETSGFLICFIKTTIEAEPECLEHASIGWFLPKEIRELDLAPADEVFSAKLILGTPNKSPLA
ncbi:MAG: NUDIX domain-containing protein [Pseudomonadaceae bacterium]|nr:NUDIX domain-containing protein [Pseudomonadaceae bacterium]